MAYGSGSDKFFWENLSLGKWRAKITNVWPLTTDFTLHNTALIIHCQAGKFFQPASLENSSAIFCIIGFVILIIIWLRFELFSALGVQTVSEDFVTNLSI